MGLSIVSALVRKHEGKLVFSRSELGGLEITLFLPFSSTAHREKK